MCLRCAWEEEAVEVSAKAARQSEQGRGGSPKSARVVALGWQNLGLPLDCRGQYKATLSQSLSLNKGVGGGRSGNDTERKGRSHVGGGWSGSSVLAHSGPLPEGRTFPAQDPSFPCEGLGQRAEGLG